RRRATDPPRHRPRRRRRPRLPPAPFPVLRVVPAEVTTAVLVHHEVRRGRRRTEASRRVLSHGRVRHVSDRRTRTVGDSDGPALWGRLRRPRQSAEPTCELTSTLSN